LLGVGNCNPKVLVVSLIKLKQVFVIVDSLMNKLLFLFLKLFLLFMIFYICFSQLPFDLFVLLLVLDFFLVLLVLIFLQQLIVIFPGFTFEAVLEVFQLFIGHLLQCFLDFLTKMMSTSCVMCSKSWCYPPSWCSVGATLS
jgi:hypothetical protein